jgi:hypothetical protein
VHNERDSSNVITDGSSVVTVFIKSKKVIMKSIIYAIIIFSLLVMVGSLVSMFIKPDMIGVSTFIFVLSAVLGTSSMLAIDKK